MYIECFIMRDRTSNDNHFYSNFKDFNFYFFLVSRLTTFYHVDSPYILKLRKNRSMMSQQIVYEYRIWIVTGI